MLEVSNPSEFPDPTRIDAIEEPYVKAQIIFLKSMLVRLWSWRNVNVVIF